MEPISILLPAKGRYAAFARCIDSLAATQMAEELIELVIVIDDDPQSIKVTHDCLKGRKFKEVYIHNSKTRMYSVRAFNLAWGCCLQGGVC